MLYRRLRSDVYSRVEGVKVLVSEPENEVGPVRPSARGVGVAGEVDGESSHSHHDLGLG